MPTTPAIDTLADSLACLAEGRDVEAAWSRVQRLAGGHIARVAGSIARDPALTDDAVQEALIALRRGAATFRPPAAGADEAARRWVVAVTANSALRLLRQRRVRCERPLDLAAEALAPAASDRVEREDLLGIVYRELGELPETVREAITLRHVAGLGYEQIAEVLHIPVGTAKTHVHRGLEQVRERLRGAGRPLLLAALIGLLETAVCADTGMPLPPIRTPSGPTPMELGSIMKIAIAVAAALLAGAIPLISAQEDAHGAPPPAPVPPQAKQAPGAQPGAPAAEEREGDTVIVIGEGAGAGLHACEGILASATAKELVLTVAGATAGTTANKTLPLGAGTKVMLDGKAVKPADLKPGVEIEAVLDAQGVVLAVNAESAENEGKEGAEK
jgi:RNA polymerase sigma-70 factor (ECF subfamily)